MRMSIEERKKICALASRYKATSGSALNYRSDMAAAADDPVSVDSGRAVETLH